MKRHIYTRERKTNSIRQHSTRSNSSQKRYARRNCNVINNSRIYRKIQQNNTALITNSKDNINTLDLPASSGYSLTVLELVEKYIATKIYVREPTRAGYKTVINLLKKEPFGNVINLHTAKILIVSNI